MWQIIRHIIVKLNIPERDSDKNIVTITIKANIHIAFSSILFFAFHPKANGNPPIKQAAKPVGLSKLPHIQWLLFNVGLVHWYKPYKDCSKDIVIIIL